MTDLKKMQGAPSVDVGELLKEHRLKMGEEITDVIAKTKISEYVIERMESNDFSEISTPVYVRGYLSQYAKYLGLDVSYVLNEYNVQYPDKVVAIRSSAAGDAPFNTSRVKSKRRSKTVSFFIAAVVFCLLGYAYYHFEPSFLSKGTDVPVMTDDGNTEMDVALDGADVAQNLANDVLSGDSIAGAPSAVISPSLVNDTELDIAISPAAKAAEIETQKSLAEEQKLLAESKKKSADAEIDLTSISDGEQNSEVNENTDTDAESIIEENTEENSGATKRILMTFKRRSWVKIVDANGKKLAARIYKKGQTVDVTGKPPLNMKIGSPESLRVMSIDGRAVSLSNYQVRGIRFRVK